MTKPVLIHAGAHRTGTSSFQLCLHENRAVLDRHGYDIAYPGRDGVQGGNLRLPLPRRRHGEKRIPQYAEQARDVLAALSPEAGRGLILSEENIPGPMLHFYQGQFFPASRKRFLSLAGALEAPPVHVLYVVRSYADLFVSAYRKRAEDNPVVPFSEIVPNFLAIDRGWPELLSEMRDTLGAETLTVLPYEGRGSSCALLKRLVPGLVGEVLVEPSRTVNQSATDAALEALQARYRAGETLPRRVWQGILQDNLEKTDRTGFAAFPEAERRELQARYDMDIARLSELEGISFQPTTHPV
ncbi:hypothetical protein [Sedimentitalea todarodis]|uniref:Sulfotransferase domain-containing protein n=1 Tax=Sedimentitalea todarodis TaxID=1631240 RepID=A0ABU3VC86_9RHOB|nr:hypothetical protein [Sedimentitalea todarodis]MDU9003785.1 hypothetical protein [Sedimentitalea todarodis]